MYTAEEFSTLMDYIHRGECRIGPKNVIGLFVAADEFNLINLKRSCVNFLGQHLSSDNVIYILTELERFQSRDCAIELEPLVYNYVRQNAEKVLSEATVALMSKSQLIRVLCLEGLQVPEINKFHAALIWTKVYVRKNKESSATIQFIFTPFLNCVKLTRIPIQSLVDDVRRSKVVPERMLAHACSYNEHKESFNSAHRKWKPLSTKKKSTAASYQQPFVVGMNSSVSGSSDTQRDHGKSSSRKFMKKAKNTYDVSHQTLADLDSKASNPRLTKTKRTLSSAGTQVPKPTQRAPRSDVPTFTSFKPKLIRTSKSSRLLISSSSELTASTPSRPRLTKSSKVSAPLLDIMF